MSVGQGIGKGGQVLAALVLVRALSPAEWSAMALVLSIYIAAVGMGTLNIQHSVFFFYGRVARDRRRSLALQTGGMLAASGLVTGVIVLASGRFLGDAYDSATLLPWLAMVVALEIPTLATPQILLAAERPGTAAVYEAVLATVQVVALAAPAAAGYGPLGSLQALTAYAAFRLVLSAVLVAAVLPRGPLRIHTRMVIEQALYTAPLALSIGTTVLNRSIDKWLVAGIDPDGFGAYSVAAHEIPLISVIPFAVGAVLATRMVHAFNQGDPARARDYWLAQTARMSFIVVPGAIALVVAAPEVVELLFTREYLDAILPFQLYTLILLHRVAEYGMLLRAAGDTRSLWYASAFLLGANVLFSVPFTLQWGMVGAAIGTLVANELAWFFVLTRIARCMKVDVGRALPWRIYLSVLAVAAAAGAASHAVREAAGLAALPSLVLALAVYGALCAGGIVALRLPRRVPPVPEEDRELAADLANR